jgi:hypothetical protein
LGTLELGRVTTDLKKQNKKLKLVQKVGGRIATLSSVCFVLERVFCNLSSVFVLEPVSGRQK